MSFYDECEDDDFDFDAEHREKVHYAKTCIATRLTDDSPGPHYRGVVNYTSDGWNDVCVEALMKSQHVHPDDTDSRGFSARGVMAHCNKETLLARVFFYRSLEKGEYFEEWIPLHLLTRYEGD